MSAAVAARPRGRGKSPKSLKLIAASHEILSKIWPASVRAVCYQLFLLKLILDMSKGSTDRVGRQLTWAREQGRIPWNWIVDETRAAEPVPSWADPAAYSLATMRDYRRDRWVLQPRRVEVWSEKGTIRGTLAPVLQEYGVTLRVFHGYSSATAVHDVAEEDQDNDRPLIALYAGDWDPSGLHMSEADLPRRLAKYGGAISLQRIALTEPDIADPELPSFPAADKRKDPRYRWFASNYGPTCWELDALSPVVLRDRVRRAIGAEIEWDAWERCGKAEAAERASLEEVLGGWKAARTP